MVKINFHIFVVARLKVSLLYRYATYNFTAMNRSIYHSVITSLLAALCVGCGGSVAEKAAESAAVEVVATRYGVVVAGYELRESTVQSGETMGSIMNSYGRSARDIDRVDRASRDLFPLREMRAGDRYTAFIGRDSTGRATLDYIAYERDRLNYVLFVMCGDSVSTYLAQKPSKVVRQSRVVEIDQSLWSAIMQADMPHDLGVEMEEIYRWSIDFFDIRRGDQFSVIYDERFVDDSLSVGMVAVHGVKFTHRKREYYAIPFTQDGRREYWNESGSSLRMDILKAPLRYARVGSRFSNSNYKPRFRVAQASSGVDYAAPTGTPVIAVADGVVLFCGSNSEDGNMIKLQHTRNLATGYLHLNRFARDVKVGSRVLQGELIGYVGSTGSSAKHPHLEYRMWSDGVLIDPLDVEPLPIAPITDENRAAFDEVCQSTIAALNAAGLNSL